MAKILNGREVATSIEQQLTQQLNNLRQPLTLGIIQVGDNPSSNAYIRQKIRKASQLGIETQLHRCDESIAFDQLSKIIDQWNRDSNITGFIIQLPLPRHLNTTQVLNLISPEKDVDALTSISLGRLSQNDYQIMPATSRGILSILDYYNIELEGRNVLIIGRSALVGKPTMLSLVNRNATVTLAHSYSQKLEELTKNADIIIAATGQQNLINAELVNSKTIIIDVGINSTDEGLKGDVDYASVEPVVQAITPVPGGVGPLTVMSLFQNLLDLHPHPKHNSP